MKKYIFLFVIFMLNISPEIHAQANVRVDRIVEEYPAQASKLRDITDLINHDFSLPDEKARAIYYWIAHHIVYDVEATSSLQRRISYTSEEQKKAKELKIRNKWAKKCIAAGKAECEGYATLYKCMCDLVSVPCIIIPGNVKRSENDIGNPKLKTNHAWNAVQINGEWKIVDVTWAAGYIDYSTRTFYPVFDDVFFLTEPDRYVYSHFPADTNYLFTDCTKEQYIDFPFYYSEYIDKDYVIIEPKTGILKVKGNSRVTFKIKSEKGVDHLWYSFDEEPVLHKILVQKKGDSYEFMVPFTSQKRNILNLYYKRRGMVTFKVKN